MNLPTSTDISSAASEGIASAFKLIEDSLSLVDKLICEQLSYYPDKSGVNSLIEHVSSQRGKMLRPSLVLLSGNCCGKITDEHIYVAAIFEIIHNATLLHDDVIDESQKRRGADTVNHLWGNRSAILLGDFFLSQVFKMCANVKPEIVKIIASGVSQTCEGELIQTMKKVPDTFNLTEVEYIETITKKSAALFSSCCLTGSLLAGANDEQCKALADYGLNIGIAFQVTDDLLDILGSEKQIGKPVGNDISKKKLTLALIHFLAVADERGKADIMQILDSPDGEESTRNRVVDILKQTDSLKYARDKANDYCTKAISSLAPLQDDKTKNALIKISEFVVERLK